MITAKQLRELLQAKPFKPFRICRSDGPHYDITNHDMASVGKNTVEVDLNLIPIVSPSTSPAVPSFTSRNSKTCPKA